MTENKFRILLIEDDLVLRRGLARMFSLNEADVTHLANGREAIDIIDREFLDLIICDLRLPGMDGLAILDHLRRTGKKTHFILMTAYYSEELAGKAEKLGASAVFEKPLVLTQLREKCWNYLEQNRRDRLAN
jgi:two-component system, response regulator, stage 0 sporulation protein F